MLLTTFLFHLLYIIEFPRAVEGRRLRAIDAEGGPPPFARDGLDPHTFFARRSLWAEVEIVGAVCVCLWFFQVRAYRRPVLVGGDQGARVAVINGI